MADVQTLRQQPQHQAFGNSIRGDVSTCRFDVAHAVLVLPEKNTRRVISHSFDAQKSRENEASSERQAGKPQGKRWSAAAEWQEQHQRKRSQQEQDEEQKQVKQLEETLAGILRQLPEYQTSEAHPLRPETPSADQDCCSGEQPKPCKTVSFIQRSHCLKGSLDTSSLEPSGKAADDVIAEGEALVAAAAEQKKQQQLMEELAEKILQEYPHGVPKRLQQELSARGIILPAVGFGEAHTAPDRAAAFSMQR